MKKLYKDSVVFIYLYTFLFCMKHRRREREKIEYANVRIPKPTYDKLVKLKGAYLIEHQRNISLGELIDALLLDQIPEVNLVERKNREEEGDDSQVV